MNLSEFCVRKSIELDALLMEIKNEFSPELVVIGGSLAEGFGNATSDLDIYCFTFAPPKIEAGFQLVGGDSTFYRQVRYTNEIRTDLKILPIQQLKTLQKALLSANVSNGSSQETFISDELLVTAQRITCGLTTYRTHRGWRLESLLLNIRNQLQAYLVRLCAFRRDMNRAIAAEETNSFVYRLRSAVRAIEAEIDRQLAHQGQLNVRFDKWRLQKARAIASHHPHIERVLKEVSEHLSTNAELMESLNFIDEKIILLLAAK